MKFMVVGDCHLSDKPPSLRTNTYSQDILDKLTFIVSKAEEENCDALVQLGDLYHHKHPSKTSHELVQRTHDVLTAPNIPVIVVPGNHDVVNDRMDSLPQQPLGSLGKMPGVTLLQGPHPTMPIYGIPYLQEWDDLPSWLDDYKEWAAEDAQDCIPLLGMHAPIFPTGQEPPYDYVAAADVAEHLDGWPTTVGFGHIHDPHEHWQEKQSCDVTFANYGAISRGSLHTETLKRQPRAYIYDSDTGKVEPFDVPCKPVDVVFRMVEHEAAKTKTEHMTKFLEQIGPDKSVSSSLEEVLSQLSRSNDAADVDDSQARRRAVELIEWAQE